MNKSEFLNELQNALEGRISKSDIEEITADYNDIFDNAISDGKSEDDIAKEIGSPAKIARTILEDGNSTDTTRTSRLPNTIEIDSGKNKGNREYTDFQKNINEKTSNMFDKVVEPDRNVNINNLASMSSRLGAYLIDGIILGVITIGIALVLFAPVYYIQNSSVIEMGANQVVNVNDNVNAAYRFMEVFPRNFYFGSLIILLIVFSGFNFFTAIFLWVTNGYTPGKWLLRMRVVKINGHKLSFLDALLRDVVVKCIANAFLSGFLNLGSFIWACLTEDHKTVHDLMAQTRVVNVNRKKQPSDQPEQRNRQK